MSSGASGVRAGRAFVELALEDNRFRRALDAAQSRLVSFASVMAKAGVGIGLAGAAGYTAMDALESHAVGYAATFSQLRERLGGTTEGLSALAYAVGTAGVSLDELQGHFENLNERIGQAVIGTGEAVETFRNLGINARQMAIDAPEEKLIRLSNAMRRVTNDTERLAILSTLGGDQFQKLNPFLKLGEKEIRNRFADAKAFGLVVSKEQGDRARDVSYAYHQMFSALEGVGLAIGYALIPSEQFLDTWISATREAAIQVRTWIEQNGKWIQYAEYGVYATLGLAAAFLGVSGASYVLSAAISTLGVPIRIVTGLIGLLAPTVAITAGLVSATWAAMSAVVTTGTAAMSTSWLAFGGIFAGVRAALVAGWASIISVQGLSTAAQAVTTAAWAAGLAIWTAATSVFAALRTVVVGGYGAMTAATAANGAAWITWAGIVAAAEAINTAGLALEVAMAGAWAAAWTIATQVVRGNWTAARATILSTSALSTAAAAASAAGAYVWAAAHAAASSVAIAATSAWAAVRVGAQAINTAGFAVEAAAATAWAATMSAAIFAVSGSWLTWQTVSTATQAIWSATLAAMSAVWMTFTGVYAAGQALVLSGSAIIGAAKIALSAAWSVSLAVMQAAWVGFQVAFLAGKAVLIGGIALLKAAVLALPAAILGLVIYWAAFSESGKAVLKGLSDSISSWFSAAFESVMQGWSAMTAALGRGDFTTAWKVGLAALDQRAVEQFQRLVFGWLAGCGRPVRKYLVGCNTRRCRSVDGLPRIFGAVHTRRRRTDQDDHERGRGA
jgi:hypothetical protein